MKDTRMCSFYLTFLIGATLAIVSCPNIHRSGYLAGDEFASWEVGASYYAKWSRSLPTNPGFFPIAVWLQNPSNAGAYKAIGIDLFIGLYQGPTEAHLGTLASGQMPVFCDQNATGLYSSNNGVIKAWTHQDEPDNAQSDGNGGYGPPVATSTVFSLYQSMVANDPARPVYLNLGMGVAWDGWYGRGERTNHPEDYPEYAKGADILSFDIYPVNLNGTENGKVWLVAYGVDRLRLWSDYKKPVFNWIECTQIDSTVGTSSGAFRDSFTDYTVHLYRVENPR